MNAEEYKLTDNYHKKIVQLDSDLTTNLSRTKTTPERNVRNKKIFEQRVECEKITNQKNLKVSIVLLKCIYSNRIKQTYLMIIKLIIYIYGSITNLGYETIL